MKFIVKKNKECIIFLVVVLISVFLSACGGVTPGTNPPTINSFTADFYNIISGESVILSWNVTGADSVTIDYGIGSVALTGTTSVSPATTTTYTITATNASESVTATTTITVGSLVTVTYNGNGSTGGTAPVDPSIPYDSGATVTVLDKGDLVKTGHTFDGWNTQADGSGTDHAVGSTFIMGASDMTIYAKWTPLYALRDTGPAGGLIFYVKEGGYSDDWMYLEAAPSDQSTSAPWGCHRTLIPGADGITVGTGKQNTTDIVAGCATVGTAADICANLGLGGYSDWFLPSKDELNQMYENLYNIVTPVGGFADSNYWSSSEDDASYAWVQLFSLGLQYITNKDNNVRVRAVRAF